MGFLSVSFKKNYELKEILLKTRDIFNYKKTSMAMMPAGFF